ncbi:MAG TPA: hypothetical protein DHV36_14290 [Desulfobacteraceae bacterium]|nr:hypothetical protein [Desulfobacteraceae bacterium]|tara:strand:- start:55 stop:885 length:831 start_codon:yes stop_codon:yes gene_type:complete
MTPKTDVKFYRDAGLKGIDICRANNSRHNFPEHFHDDLYIIGHITAGACYCLEVGNSDTIAEPGGVTLLNPGQIHSGVPLKDEHLTYTMCHIPADTLAGMAEDVGISENKTPEFTTPVTQDPKAAALVSHLFSTLINSRDSLEKEVLMLSATHFLLSRHGGRQSVQKGTVLRHQPVVRARDLLAGELDRKMTLAEVSRSVGLSQYHFIRAFKRETGLSPHMYRTLKRIERASSLLRSGMPPAQVALETGFSDQSHFANTFRRYMGATPKQYMAMTA